MLQQFIGALRFLFVQAADGEAYMDQDVVANLGFRHEIEEDRAPDSAELDHADAAVADRVGFHQFSGHRQAHSCLLLRCRRTLKSLGYRAARSSRRFTVIRAKPAARAMLSRTAGDRPMRVSTRSGSIPTNATSSGVSPSNCRALRI